MLVRGWSILLARFPRRSLHRLRLQTGLAVLAPSRRSHRFQDGLALTVALGGVARIVLLPSRLRGRPSGSPGRSARSRR